MDSSPGMREVAVSNRSKHNGICNIDFNIKKLWILLTGLTYKFCLFPRINIDCFHKLHYLSGLCNWCVRKDWKFLSVICSTFILQGLSVVIYQWTPRNQQDAACRLRFSSLRHLFVIEPLRLEMRVSVYETILNPRKEVPRLLGWRRSIVPLQFYLPRAPWPMSED
jgi:hypothetical protein